MQTKKSVHHVPNIRINTAVSQMNHDLTLSSDRLINYVFPNQKDMAFNRELLGTSFSSEGSW